MIFSKIKNSNMESSKSQGSKEHGEQMTFSFNFSNRDLKLTSQLKHILFVNTG